MKRHATIKISWALAGFAILGVGGVAEADFLIILRNGGEFKVLQYEEVGDQIVFQRFGGRGTIPKTHVATIENLQTGDKRVFDRFGRAQEPKAPPRETRTPARTSPAEPQGPAQDEDTPWFKYMEAGSNAYQKGRYLEAEMSFQAALKEAEKFGPQDRRLPTTLLNLAKVYFDQDRYAEAEPLFRRALETAEKALGPADPLVAQSLNDLAVIYRHQGKLAKVEPLLRRSLAIRQKALGPGDPLVAQSLHNLAVFYRDQDRYAEAEPLFRRSLAIMEKAIGPDHPLVASSLQNYAVLLRKTNRAAEAAKMEARAHEIRVSRGSTSAGVTRSNSRPCDPQDLIGTWWRMTHQEAPAGPYDGPFAADPSKYQYYFFHRDGWAVHASTTYSVEEEQLPLMMTFAGDSLKYTLRDGILVFRHPDWPGSAVERCLYLTQDVVDERGQIFGKKGDMILASYDRNRRPVLFRIFRRWTVGRPEAVPRP